METQNHLTVAELENKLDWILASPQDKGALEWIVRRPGVDEREALPEGRLDLSEGLVGDNWKSKGSSRTADGSAHPDMQLNLMNARVISVLAGEKDRWALAGDQLFVDLDLSAANLPAGTRLWVGSAVIEVTAQPHTGCRKFAARFGLDAMRWVNSPELKHLRLRGINAKVVQPGMIRVGDQIRKI
jgi:hypothetical protein